MDTIAANTSTNATIATGGTRSSAIDFLGDRDWFRTTLSTGFTYNITLQGDGGPSTLPEVEIFVYDANGVQLLNRSDFGLNGIESVSFTAATGGTYYIAATGEDDTEIGDYILSLGEDDVARGIGTAGTLAVDGSVTGTIGTNGDRDWYRVSLEDGLSYGVTLNGIGANALGEVELFLYDANGVQLANQPDFGTTGTETITFTAPDDGIYYIAATGENDVRRGDYRLSLTGDDQVANVSTTSNLAIDGSVTGRISTNGDRDWHRVTLEDGLSYAITLAGIGADDLSEVELFIYNANGVQLFNQPDFGATGTETVTFTAPDDGVYYIAATGENDVRRGDYRLSIVGDDLTADVDTASTVAVGGSVTGRISTNGDRDWHRVTLEDSLSYAVTLEGIGAQGLNEVELFIYDDTGTQLVNRADFGATGTETVTFTPGADGTYYIAATGENDVRRGDYRLSVGTDEARNDVGTTSTLAVDGSRTGTIGALGDRDWYRTSLEDGFTYGVRLEGRGANGLNEVEIFLYDANGSLLVNRADFGTLGTETIAFTASEDATYYVAATGENDARRGDYTVSLIGDDFSRDIDSDGAIAIGSAVTGTIGVAGDRDWFRAVLEAGEDYDITLEGDGTPGGLSQVEFDVYDANGTFVQNFDAGSVGAITRTFTPTTSGTYYVSARGRNDGFAGSYALSLAGDRPLTTGTAVDDVLIGDVASENFFGLGGDDVIAGNGGADTLDGGTGNDILAGGDGNDFLIGGTGDDVLSGGDGNDQLVGGLGADRLDGGAGIDRARYVDAASGVLVDLALSQFNTGEAAGDTFFSIEGVVGSRARDTLRGSNDDDQLFGFDGGDTLFGRGGDDVLSGGRGSDVLIGNTGDDVFNGGAGGDSIRGGSGTDRVQYTDASAGVRVDLVLSQSNTGDARGDAFSSIENVRGSDFNDDLRGTGVANVLEGGDGNDVLIGRGGDDVLSGGGGADLLIGGEGADVFDGGAGRDRAQYGNAATGVRVDLEVSTSNTGEAAGDTFISIEDLSGSSMNDALLGNAGANRIQGQDGNDALIGRNGSDILLGGNGNDVLRGGGGNDQLTGGAGTDTFRFDSPAASEGIDVIADFATNVDQIALDDAGFSSLSAGALSAANFRAGGVALDGNDYILFDAATGALSYDADANGSGAAVTFATLSGNATIDADDILVF